MHVAQLSWSGPPAWQSRRLISAAAGHGNIATATHAQAVRLAAIVPNSATQDWATQERPPQHLQMIRAAPPCRGQVQPRPAAAKCSRAMSSRDEQIKIEATRLAKELSGHYREIGKRPPWPSEASRSQWSEPYRASELMLGQLQARGWAAAGSQSSGCAHDDASRARPRGGARAGGARRLRGLQEEAREGDQVLRRVLDAQQVRRRVRQARGSCPNSQTDARPSAAMFR